MSRVKKQQPPERGKASSVYLLESGEAVRITVDLKTGSVAVRGGSYVVFDSHPLTLQEYPFSSG